MPIHDRQKINGKDTEIMADLHYDDPVAEPGVKEVEACETVCVLKEVDFIQEVDVIEKVQSQAVAVPRYPPTESNQDRELNQKRRDTLIIALASLIALMLKPPTAGGSGVRNFPHPVCHSVRYSYLHKCAPDVLCAAPVGAPLGTRFFAYDLPDGVVLFPDTGNVTVPASKHGSVSFRVFAESPDPSGAPGYVQSVVVRHEEVLAQPESMLQMAAYAALNAMGGAAGFAIYWLVTQND